MADNTAVAENQQRLDNAFPRSAYSPPPPYSARQSFEWTRFQRSDRPSDEQQRREERKWQLIAERRASIPYNQLDAQEKEEEEWLIQTDKDGTHPRPGRVNFAKLARDNVKKRWVEQGLWGEKWTSTASTGVWKREKPLAFEPELETDNEREPRRSLFAPPSPPKPPKSEKEKRRIAEQRFLRLRAREAEREASRPFHQFVYQISHQRGRIQDRLGNEDARAGASTNADINTKAYENVKKFWVKQKIWDQRWGILPGMSWKHEEPFVEEEVSAPAQTNLPENHNQGVVERPLVPTSIFNPLETDLHPASLSQLTSPQGRPADSEDTFPQGRPTGTEDTSQQGRPTGSEDTSEERRAADTEDTSQQGCAADRESAGLANSDTEHPSPESNSHGPNNGKRISCPTMRRVAQPKATDEDEQIQQNESPSLGHTHTSKVSKVPMEEKSGRRQQRLEDCEIEYSDNSSVATGADVAEATSSTPGAHPPRRSHWLTSPTPTVAEIPKS